LKTISGVIGHGALGFLAFILLLPLMAFVLLKMLKLFVLRHGIGEVLFWHPKYARFHWRRFGWGRGDSQGDGRNARR
jgi:hypothetical protein